MTLNIHAMNLVFVEWLLSDRILQQVLSFVLLYKLLIACTYVVFSVWLVRLHPTFIHLSHSHPYLHSWPVFFVCQSSKDAHKLAPSFDMIMRDTAHSFILLFKRLLLTLAHPMKCAVHIPNLWFLDFVNIDCCISLGRIFLRMEEILALMNGRLFLSDSPSPNRPLSPQACLQPSSIYPPAHPSDPVIAYIWTTTLEPSHIH